jgi:ribosomal protein S18 acetylase RimI-like enzyme
MRDLIANIDKLHATDLGAERIKKNLSLRTSDVVLWCKDCIKRAGIVMKPGKNWYVYRNGIVLTVNARSYTIITAHKLNAKVRVMRKFDPACLREFLFQAVFIPTGADPPSRDVIDDSRLFSYIKDFGTQEGDLGVVAEQNGQAVGAAWARIMQAYGHIDAETPELAISVLPGFRGYGVGTKLMKKLFGVLRGNGYARTSLSVQKENPAVRFYKRLGYKTVSENDNDCIMVRDLGENKTTRFG